MWLCTSEEEEEGKEKRVKLRCERTVVCEPPSCEPSFRLIPCVSSSNVAVRRFSVSSLLSPPPNHQSAATTLLKMYALQIIVCGPLRVPLTYKHWHLLLFFEQSSKRWIGAKCNSSFFLPTVPMCSRLLIAGLSPRTGFELPPFGSLVSARRPTWNFWFHLLIDLPILSSPGRERNHLAPSVTIELWFPHAYVINIHNLDVDLRRALCRWCWSSCYRNRNEGAGHS